MEKKEYYIKGEGNNAKGTQMKETTMTQDFQSIQKHVASPYWGHRGYQPPLVVLWKITHHWIPCGKKYGRKFSIPVSLLNLQALDERLREMNPKMMQIPQGEKSIHKWLPPVKRYIASFKRGVLGDMFMACCSIMERGINLLDALGVTHYLWKLLIYKR